MDISSELRPPSEESLSASAPPLRIHHILIVTAVASSLLSVNQLLRSDDLLGLTRMFASTWGAMYTISTAISLTLVGLGIAWRRAGYPFFALPGHWLLVTNSLGIGLFLAIAVALALHTPGGGNWNMLPLTVYFLGVQLTLFLVSVYAAVRVADSVAWRIYFIVQASQLVLMFSTMLSPRLVVIHQYLPFVMIALLLAAAAGDWLAKRPRDWPHWVGVALPFAVLISYFLNMLQG